MAAPRGGAVAYERGNLAASGHGPLSSEKDTTIKTLKTLNPKPGPESGPDCLVCANFARQRPWWQLLVAVASTDRTGPWVDSHQPGQSTSCLLEMGLTMSKLAERGSKCLLVLPQLACSFQHEDTDFE